jgi:hypothetical protein
LAPGCSSSQQQQGRASQKRLQRKQQQQQRPVAQLVGLLGNAAGPRQAAARPQQLGELLARLQEVLRLALQLLMQCNQAVVSPPAAAAAEGQLAVPQFLHPYYLVQALQQQLHLLLPWTHWQLCWLVAAALFAAGCSRRLWTRS